MILDPLFCFSHRMTSLQPENPPTTAAVGQGCVLDCRRALINPTQGWMVISDVHFGFELNRARRVAQAQPEWGMATTQSRLLTLLEDYKPRTLILNGDIMDGGGSVRETERLLATLRECVADLVLVEGNHDRSALKKGEGFLPWYQTPGFIFHHGHRFSKIQTSLPEGAGPVHICGHEHPSLSISDGAGLRLKMPALIQDHCADKAAQQHWILPAFSPWAGGTRYESGNTRIATWGCGDDRIIGL
jgi:uncharacterized protein